MKARVYDLGNSYIMECKAVYSREGNTVYLSGDKEIVERISESAAGNAFLLHYTDATQGIFDFQCQYTGYEQEGPLYVVAMQVEDTIKTVQRRQDLKMRTNIPIRLTLLDPDDKITTDPDTKKAVQINAILRDISAGGVMVDIESPLEVDQKIMFPFDKGSSPIMIQAQVLREQEQAGTYHRYGCKFYNHNSGKESIVREYVFRLEASRNYTARSSRDL